jgi:hypothetical protein
MRQSMQTNRIAIASLFFFHALLLACSSSSEGGSSSAVIGACKSQCEAWRAACPSFTMDCGFCEFGIVNSSRAGCEEKYIAAVKCENTQGYSCVGPGVVTKNAEACADAAKADRVCRACTGAGEDGFCPSVECTCPGGKTTHVSGQRSTSGGCACFTTADCADACD